MKLRPPWITGALRKALPVERLFAEIEFRNAANYVGSQDEATGFGSEGTTTEPLHLSMLKAQPSATRFDAYLGGLRLENRIDSLRKPSDNLAACQKRLFR